MNGLPWLSEAQFKAEIWRYAMWFASWQDGRAGIPWAESWAKTERLTDLELGEGNWNKDAAFSECRSSHDNGSSEARRDAARAKDGVLPQNVWGDPPATAAYPPLIGRYEAR
jgi:hypothetical protein